MENDLASNYGPWAVIAGASEGIGASFAHQLAAAGIHLVLIARRPNPLEELSNAITEAYGVETRILSVDLTEGDGLSNIIEQTLDLEVGLLVYNAGATHGAVFFHDTTVDRSLSLVQLNCVGPVVLAHHFGGLMRDRQRGGMIFLSSVSSVCGSAYTATYAATKAFDVNLAEGLWAELSPHGVDVLALVAGATDTPAMERSGAVMGGQFPGMDPDDVAREGLEHLGHGPTWVAGEQNQVNYDMLRALPRADAIGFMTAGARAIFQIDTE